jgi:hypothetical protein
VAANNGSPSASSSAAMLARRQRAGVRRAPASLGQRAIIAP